MQESIKVVIDTNIFISFLITDSFDKIDPYLESGRIRLLINNEYLEEFIDVTKRPKFKKYYSDEDVTKLLSKINYSADIIEAKSIFELCRDKKDDYLLALSADGKADYLITGDKDLLVLKRFKNTIILKLTEFIKLHKP